MRTTASASRSDAVTTIDLPGMRKLKSGKVREVFDLGDALLFVATDRISAFDCILPNGIPGKGHVLNQLSAWWFNRLSSIAPHHMITASFDEFPDILAPYEAVLRGRSMIVRRADVIPIECVARGYLIGSGWQEYLHTGRVSHVALPSGLRLADHLDEPLFTPARKAETGHDENISFADVERAIGREQAVRLRDLTLALYTAAAGYARGRGIIIADTKFEFGIADGQIMLVDEALTPDSSRFWPASSYAPGCSPPSFDKQFVRDYLESIPWNKQPPAPALPPEVVARTREKYLEAFRVITGHDPELRA